MAPSTKGAEQPIDTLDPREIAELLGCPRSLVYKLAARGEIPVFRLGAKICARRPTLIAWIEAQERANRAHHTAANPSGRRR